MSANLSLAAWGGQAVRCRAANGLEDCALTMADTSGGGAGLCLHFAAGAVGGAVPEEGWYCACAEFRSGADCAVVDPLVYIVVAIQLGTMGIVVWLFMFAQETQRDIVRSGKAGMKLPKRLVFVVKCTAAIALGWLALNILLLVAPVPYWGVSAVQVVLSSLTSSAFAGAGGVLLVSFRQVVQSATTGQGPPAWEARAADLYLLFVFAATLAAPLSVRPLVSLGVGVVITVPNIALGFKIKRMIDDVSSMKVALSADSQVEFTAAANRIMCLLRHVRFFLICFVATRVATVGSAKCPVLHTDRAISVVHMRVVFSI